MAKILYRGIRYLRGDDLRPEEGHLLIDDGKIAGLGPGLPFDPEAKVLSGEGLLAVPGFVNSHTHIAMTLLRGYGGDQALASWLNDYIWPAEARLTDEDVYWGSALAIAEMLRYGVTCIADMYDHMEIVAKIVEESGIRANLCRGMIGINDQDGHALRENDALYAVWNHSADDRIRIWYGPHATNTCPPDYLERVAARAHQLETGIHIHIAETRAEVEDIQARYGMSPVALADRAGIFDGPCLLAHGVWLDEDDMAILKRKNVSVVHNPASNLKLASGIAPVARLLARGVNVALGTDGASSNNQLSLLREAQLAALLAKGATEDPTVVNARQALAMATIHGARALHWDDTIGSIEVGKAADLAIIDLKRPWLAPNLDLHDSLIYAAQSTDVVQTYVAGRLLYDRGTWPTLPMEQILREVHERSRALING